MKNDVQMLKANEISSDVFVVSPELINAIAQKFGNAVAEEMNVRPLSEKIQQIAHNVLIKILHDAKNMGA